MSLVVIVAVVVIMFLVFTMVMLIMITVVMSFVALIAVVMWRPIGVEVDPASLVVDVLLDLVHILVEPIRESFQGSQEFLIFFRVESVHDLVEHQEEGSWNVKALLSHNWAGVADVNPSIDIMSMVVAIDSVGMTMVMVLRQGCCKGQARGHDVESEFHGELCLSEAV